MLDIQRRKNIVFALIVIVASLLLLYGTGAVFSIPSRISMLIGNSHFLDLASPLHFSVHPDKEDILKINDMFVSRDGFRLDSSGPFQMESVGIGEVNLEFRLFGLIPVKRVTVDVLPYIEVIPGGEAIGVLLAPEGVMVTGFETLIGSGFQRISPAKEKGVMIGDIILSVNGQQVYDRVYFNMLLTRIGSVGSDVELKLKRDERIFTVRIKPVAIRTTKEQGSSVKEYSIGLVVSDNAAGVGTLTFYHPQSKRYGALGHVIIDPRTKKSLNITDGRIVNASISAIHQGQKGKPGEKIGSFQGAEDMIGSIDTNTDFGVYGELYRLPSDTMMNRGVIPVAMAHDVHTGPAWIYTVISGNTVEAFEVEIQQVFRQNKPDGKGLVLKITDERLLSLTGGIIQGMSGSPIIQDGKLVGAVTHVFVNDPTRGYGVLAEWMIMQSGILEEVLSLSAS